MVKTHKMCRKCTFLLLSTRYELHSRLKFKFRDSHSDMHIQILTLTLQKMPLSVFHMQHKMLKHTSTCNNRTANNYEIITGSLETKTISDFAK